MAQTTYHVDDDACPGPGSGTLADPYCRVQDAITASANGDTVVVQPGRYYENIHLLGKNITLRSADPLDPSVVEATILDGSQPVDPDRASVVTFLGTEQSSCVLDGLTITGGAGTVESSSRLGGGIRGHGAQATLTHCRITGNDTGGLEDGVGVGIHDLDGEIAGCEISDNTAVASFGSRGAGMAYCDGTVRDSLIAGNYICCQGQGRGGGAAFCNADFVRCIFLGNTAADDGGAYYEGNGLIEECVVENNLSEDGGGLWKAAGPIRNCLFKGNRGIDGVAALYCINCDVEDSVFENNLFGMWGAVVEGGGVARRCEFRNNGSQHATGRSTVGGSGWLIEDSLFQENSNGSYGGAIAGENLTVRRTIFAGNTAAVGGAMYLNSGTNVIEDCVFSENTAPHAGALRVSEGASASVRRSKFAGNRNDHPCSSGGAIGSASEELILSQCSFVANQSGDDYPECTETFGGGAVGLDGGSATVLDCSFVENTTGGSGGAVLVGREFGNANLDVANTIFWRNREGPNGEGIGQVIVQSGAANIGYSLLEGGWSGAGVGNLDADPLFVDPDGPDDLLGTADDDLRLSPASPCIDAGSNSAVPSGVTLDLAGFPRFLDDPMTPDTGEGTPPIVDMGAYEFSPDCNSNGIPDAADILDGTSVDCDANWNPDECDTDSDGDGVIDGCDPCPLDNPDDSDGDTICNSADVCPGHDDLQDADGDGAPDGCDPCPGDNPDDSDGDSVCDSNDICAGFDDNLDFDADGVPDGCDPCPLDNPDDTDGDGTCDSNDPCPVDNPNDSDGDGVCESADLCPGFDDAEDGDGDGTPDGCDACPLDNPDDTDGDGICESADVCPGHDDGADGDSDGQPDGCDPCPFDNPNDSDSDTVCDSADACPGFDDRVDPDGDARPSGCDNCPTMPNPAQVDFDQDGTGDACEPPLVASSEVLKARYISFVPAPHPSEVAYAVIHTASGTSAFAGEPSGLSVSLASPSIVVRGWSDVPVVHFAGCMVAPGEAYEVRATADGVNMSAPILVSTAPRPIDGRWWGDLVGGFTGQTGVPPNSWTGPDGFVNGFDIVAVVERFANQEFAPGLIRVDVNPEVPDQAVNGQDILQIVNAFSIGSGREFYPFSVPGGQGPQGQGPCEP